MIFLGDITPDDRLVIFRGAPTFRDVFAPDGSDAAYEQDLKDCRAEGHRLFFFFVDGLEVAVCSRCRTRFEEAP